eukprot:m.502303 g.502303  ORF g.502303 m.502303 type:complete len:76 (-) comp21842_c1_seq41:2039-2266(-)
MQSCCNMATLVCCPLESPSETYIYESIHDIMYHTDTLCPGSTSGGSSAQSKRLPRTHRDPIIPYTGPVRCLGSVV